MGMSSVWSLMVYEGARHPGPAGGGFAAGGRATSGPARSDSPEAVDLVQVPGPQLLVADAEPLRRRQAQHADLALVQVAVHLVGRLPGLVQRVDAGQRRVDQAALDEPVGLPRLPVVREVGADDPLEVHPQVAVVVLVEEAAGGGTGHDRATAPGDVHRGAERLPARVLEDDVDVVAAGQLADPLAEPLPFLRVLGLLVLPEPVALGAAVDDQLGAHPPADLGLLRGGDD